MFSSQAQQTINISLLPESYKKAFRKFSPICVTAMMLSLRFLALNIMEKTIMCRLWEAATDLVNLNTWFSWQSSITPVDSLPLAVGKVQGRDIEDLNCWSARCSEWATTFQDLWDNTHCWWRSLRCRRQGNFLGGKILKRNIFPPQEDCVGRRQFPLTQDYGSLLSGFILFCGFLCVNTHTAMQWFPSGRRSLSSQLKWLFAEGIFPQMFSLYTEEYSLVRRAPRLIWLYVTFF